MSTSELIALGKVHLSKYAWFPELLADAESGSEKGRRELRKWLQLCDVIPSAEKCGKISSHIGWYRGKWASDTCGCGHKFSVPTGDKGKYRCNCCADRAEG